MLAMSSLAGAVSAAELPSAPGKAELLGQPCRAKNVLAGRIVQDRKAGHEWYVLTNMNETTGAELIFIDLAHDKGHVVHAPFGAGSWALNEVPGDRLVVGTFYDGQFMVFDLNKMAFVKSVGVPGETYIWNQALGSDGRLYGGTYGSGKLAALNLDTYEVEDCGAPAPPNLYLRHVSATPDGLIYCNFITEKPVNLLFDPATKRFGPVPDSLKNVASGVTWNGYFLAENRAYQGKNLDAVTPLPFPAPPADKGDWAVLPYLTTRETLYLQQKHMLYRFTRGEKSLTPIGEIALRGGELRAGTRKGEVVGVRGQDYFVIKPGDKDLHLKPIPVESGARPTMFLKVDAKGRLWGGPHFGQTLFHMDTRTGKTLNTSTVSDNGGEVYDVAFLNGAVYAASYAGGEIIRYEPDKPWDQWNNKNPHLLANMNNAYIRPTGGIVAGADGKLYSGWMARYGTYGGAVAITDPKTGHTETIENPLGEQAIEGLAVDGNLAYISTSLDANGLPDKPNESAKFGILDLETRKVVYSHTLEKKTRVIGVQFDAKTRRVVMLADAQVLVFDTASRSFVADYPAELPSATAENAVVRNGVAYYGHEKTLIALDLQSGKTAVAAESPDGIANLAIGPDGTLFFSAGVNVYRVSAQP